jgi:hypothetical protein
MKKLKTYNLFVEGVRELMTGKSIADAKEIINNLSPQNRYENITKYNLEDSYTQEELDEFLKLTNATLKFNMGIRNNKFWAVKEGIEEDPSIIDRFNSILPSAVRRCDAQIIKYLVDLGFDANTQDAWALQLITIDSDYDKVKILIDGGAKPTANILEIALNNHKYNEDIVNLLLEHSDRKIIDQIQRWGHNYRGKFRPKDAYPYLEE